LGWRIREEREPYNRSGRSGERRSLRQGVGWILGVRGEREG
jgi:hypothetical protein